MIRRLLLAGALLALIAACNSEVADLPGDPPEPPGTEDERLRGMFRYMADAALFRDCRTDKVFPVSMEADYIELERAYLNSGIEAGSEIMVELDGRFLERPGMESNTNRVKVIVDKLHTVYPGQTCEPEVHADLTGTYWKLLQVEGKTVRTPEGGREAHMIFGAGDSKVKGYAGCNNFFAGFETRDNSLQFSAIGATRMACAQGMDIETALLQALEATTHYEIRGLFLNLYRDGSLLARFEAIYL